MSKTKTMLRDVDKDLDCLLKMEDDLTRAMNQICKDLGLIVHPWLKLERHCEARGMWAKAAYYSPEDMGIHLASKSVVNAFAILAHEICHHVVEVGDIRVLGDRYKWHGQAFQKGWIMVARACKKLGYPSPSWGLHRPMPAVE